MKDKERMTAIGERLRVAREKSGASQDEAAQAASVARSTVSNWESGRNLPCLVQFSDLMAHYGVSPFAVLFGRPMFVISAEDHVGLSKALQLCEPGLRERVLMMLNVLVPKGMPPAMT